MTPRTFIISLLLLLLATPLTYAQEEVADSLMALHRDSIPEPSDSLVLRFMEREGMPISGNNRVRLLRSGREKFADLFAAIGRARHHVHLEYFNFRDDSIANALFDLLALKVKEGVKVRAMFDAFGNWSNNQPITKKQLKAIRARGIEMVKFDPITFPYINHAAHRDHRKIAVVDGKIAYTGGMNIADYYIKGLPKIGAWRDMHVRLEGDAVHDLQRIFLDIWNKETKQAVDGPEYFPPNEAPTDSAHTVVAIVDRTPKKSSRAISHAYAVSIYSSRNDVRIINPYFVPTSSIMKALKRTIDRGVDVQIMVSSASDIPFTPDAALYKLHKLMKRGATVYLYNGGFHHSKIMMVDSLFCTVGTANLNSRSLRYDYETNAFIFDRDVTKQLNDIFEADKEHCTQLTPEYWKKRSSWKKFVGWFANLFTPFL